MDQDGQGSRYSTTMRPVVWDGLDQGCVGDGSGMGGSGMLNLFRVLVAMVLPAKGRGNREGIRECAWIAGKLLWVGRRCVLRCGSRRPEPWFLPVLSSYSILACARL